MKKAYQQPVTTCICIWKYNKFISDRWRLSQQSVGERWGPSWGHPLNMLILFHCVAHHMQNSHSKCQILLSTQEQVISMSIVKHTVFIVLEHNRVYNNLWTLLGLPWKWKRNKDVWECSEDKKTQYRKVKYTYTQHFFWSTARHRIWWEVNEMGMTGRLLFP